MGDREFPPQLVHDNWVRSILLEWPEAGGVLAIRDAIEGAISQATNSPWPIHRRTKERADREGECRDLITVIQVVSFTQTLQQRGQV
jgi:hypothetical protein